MKLLGIETSCDETGVALVEDGAVLDARVATQEIHARWGGVVPEIASRLHQKTLSRMVGEILADNRWTCAGLDGVAATRGPGLIGALLVGVSFAKGLAVARDIPYVGVNHLEGHLWAAEGAGRMVPMPALALLVSGGHTELFRVDGFGRYTFLGGTLDDAAGEAFDKVGGLLGLPYPAGAELSRLAEGGDGGKYTFPVARGTDAFSFSFSGLKTAVLRQVEALKREGAAGWEADIAASFEEAAVTQLVLRLERALEKDRYRSVMISGGVAANRLLRRRVETACRNREVELVVPPVQWCTDNGAMIAWVGWRSLLERGGDPLTLEADPNLTLAGEE